MVMVMDMRETTLPYIHLTYFGGIVLDRFKYDSHEDWVIHFSTLSPIDMNNLRQLKDILMMFFNIADKIVHKFSDVGSMYRYVIISGRIPMALLPFLIEKAHSYINVYDRSQVYVFDPKLKRAINNSLSEIDIPDNIITKLIHDYDAMVQERLKS